MTQKIPKTTANRMLLDLISLHDTGDLHNVLEAALQYADQVSALNQPHMPAGDRLLRQLELAMDEVVGGHHPSEVKPVSVSANRRREQEKARQHQWSEV